MTAAVKVWLSLLLALLVAYTGYTGWRIIESRNVVSTPDKTARHLQQSRQLNSLADSQLVDTTGQPFALDALKGQVWLASFFFSACPGPCAQMNRAIAGLQSELKDDNLKFVSITVDPNNDTPEVLAKYAAGFQADPKRWLFLSGPFEQVQRLGTEVFQVPVGPKMHTERVILVDKGSKVRGMYITSDPAQMLTLKRQIGELLAEQAPEKDAPADAAAGAPEDAPATTAPASTPAEAAPASEKSAPATTSEVHP